MPYPNYLGDPLLPSVHSTADLGSSMREIVLRARSLQTMRMSPGAHVAVRLPADQGAKRVYSVWSHRPALGQITLRIALHRTGGPGCAWALAAQAGDQVEIGRPRSKITVNQAAPYHLFIGEETGAVPLLAMRASVAEGRPVHGVFEAADESAEVPAPNGVAPIPWVHRGAASAVSSPVLLQAVRGLDLPTEPGQAYVAGESATCRLISQHLVRERGWPIRAIRVQPQWAPGRLGFGAGR